MASIRNVSPGIFRKFLQAQGLRYLRQKGDHEIWAKPGLKRPVVFRSMQHPIPEDHIASNLKTLGISKVDFLEILKNL